MVRWLAGRQLAIVTAVAIANHLGVIHAGDRGPGAGAMTGITVVGTGNIIWRHAGRLLPVVTAVAIANHLGMIDADHR